MMDPNIHMLQMELSAHSQTEHLATSDWEWWQLLVTTVCEAGGGGGGEYKH